MSTQVSQLYHTPGGQLCMSGDVLKAPGDALRMLALNGKEREWEWGVIERMGMEIVEELWKGSWRVENGEKLTDGD